MHLTSLLNTSNVPVEGLFDDFEVVSVVGHTEDIVNPGTLLITTAEGLQLEFCVARARDLGAVGVLASQSIGHGDIPVIKTPNPRLALSRISQRLHGPKTEEFRFFAVTGTNGKSTTCAALATILRSDGGPDCVAVTTVGILSRSGKSELSQHGPQTTPSSDQLWRIAGEAESDGACGAVIETSSHGLEQGRLLGFRFDVAGFTGLDIDHLDYHKSPKNYLKAKKILFGQCDAAVVRVDVRGGKKIAKAARCPVFTFSVGHGKKPTWLRLVEFDPRPDGSVGSIEIDGTSHEVRLQTQSATLASNLVLAVGMAVCSGLTPELALAGIESFSGLPGRFEAIDQCGPAVFVDYAHTPGALRSVLKDARALSTGKVWVVCGAGGDRDKSKRPDMGKVVGKLADYVVVTSDNPRSEDPSDIASELEAGGPGRAKWHRELDRAAAIEFALSEADASDVVLIAGKGHERLQEIGDLVIPFSDQQEALKFLRCAHRSPEAVIA